MQKKYQKKYEKNTNENTNPKMQKHKIQKKYKKQNTQLHFFTVSFFVVHHVFNPYAAADKTIEFRASGLGCLGQKLIQYIQVQVRNQKEAD